MSIACLGWGSLVWNPGDLLIQGNWHHDGPWLPIEFARQSRDNRITLVCVPDYTSTVQSFWARISFSTINDAREALREREGIPQSNQDKHIGIWTANSAISDDLSIIIGMWANALGLNAVIWTNLPPKFRGKDGCIPTAEEVVAHLSTLTGEQRQAAEMYIRMAPRQVRTPYRTYIEQHLKWFPDEHAV